MRGGSDPPHNAEDATVVLFTLWVVGFLLLWVWAFLSYQLGAGLIAAGWTAIPYFVREK